MITRVITAPLKLAQLPVLFSLEWREKRRHDERPERVDLIRRDGARCSIIRHHQEREPIAAPVGDTPRVPVISALFLRSRIGVTSERMIDSLRACFPI